MACVENGQQNASKGKAGATSRNGWAAEGKTRNVQGRNAVKLLWLLLKKATKCTLSR